MANYTHRCLECKHEQEETYPITSDPEIVCVICGRETTRVIQPVSFSLQGGGWATDAYHKTKKRK